MADEESGVQEQVVNPAQDDPASTSQEQVIDQSQTQPQTTESETVNNEVGNVPKENAAWAEMRVKAKQVEEENAKLKEALNSVDPEYLNRLREATAPVVPQYQDVPKLNGDADYGQVVERLAWTQQQTQLANQRYAQLQAQYEKDQDRRAEEAFPALKTDKIFQQIVAEKKLAARMLGSDKSTMEIAREVNELLGRRDQQTAQQAAQVKEQEIAQKQLVTAESRGTTSGGKSSLVDDETRMRVRKGDMNAAEQVAKNLIADLNIT